MCTKCKGTRVEFSTKSISYYQRWKSTYEKQKITKNVAPPTIWKHGYGGHSEKYSLNTSSIGRIAKHFKIEYNTLLNLGLSEGLEYDRIKSKSENPSEVEDIAIDRAMRLMDYHRLLQTYRNYLTHRSKIVNVPPTVRKFLDRVTQDVNVPKIDRIDPNKFYTLPPLQLSNYVLQKIFDDLVIMVNNGGPVEEIAHMVLKK